MANTNNRPEPKVLDAHETADGWTTMPDGWRVVEDGRNLPLAPRPRPIRDEIPAGTFHARVPASQ
jgi:hypothetical protein